MRFFVPIGPGNLLSGLHGYGLRTKGEVFDLYCILLAAGATSVLHVASDCEGGQIETTNRAQ